MEPVGSEINNVNSMKTNDVNKKVDRTTIITILTIYYALYQSMIR